MKRKTTQLEEKLLSIGYVLTSKEYKGKYSQTTDHYAYQKTILFNEKIHICNVLLDYKRSYIKNVKILCPYQGFITENDAYDLLKVFDIANNEIKETFKDKTRLDLDQGVPEEIVELVEALESDK